ncbi:glycosyltransferase [Paenibacillus sp. FSL R7-0333]|uniref:glycosyltransferase n=1 Tax=Paenibacillus sp. FSL R7-0333 TaxID=1926587 RepID=UPI0026A4C61E
MKKLWLMVFTLGLVFNLAQAGGTVQAQAGGSKKAAACWSPQKMQLRFEMQQVWIDHTIWTHNYIVSALYNNPDQKEVLARLLRNQEDIGTVFKPYYGEANGNKLAGLLKEHIQIAGQIVAAAQKGNAAEVQKLQVDWHRNADEIARFLSGLNPNWSFKEVQNMLYEHLQLVTDIVLDILKGDYAASIAATDKNEVHMIHFADLLTEGIVKQFPEKFRGK